MANDSLTKYREKRDFSKTREPSGERAPKRAKKAGLRYLIQRHDATRLHHDFRLEWDGVLWSWAVTRGPSLDPADKRLAVHVEDHPLEYGDFEGTIPKGNYGGGTVMLWDEGTWEPVGDPLEGMAKGDFKFILHGERLKGKWVLVRIKNNRDKKSKAENWLLIKERDEYVEVGGVPVTEQYLTSVRTGRTMEQIAAGDLEWVKSGAHIKSTGKTRRPKEGNDEAPRGLRRKEERLRPAAAEIRRAAARDADRSAAGGRRLGPRDQIRRLPRRGGGGGRQRQDLHAHRPRLDGQVQAAGAVAVAVAGGERAARRRDRGR